MKPSITVIGAALLDVLAGPVPARLDYDHSMPMDFLNLSAGGDAFNEALVLHGLKMPVQLVARIGQDPAGSFLEELIKKHTDQALLIRNPDVSTSINIALVNEQGERCFLSDRTSSIRTLSFQDLENLEGKIGRIVSFASLFISPALSLKDLEELFSRWKRQQKILVVDTTTPKNGETLEQLKDIFQYIDYFLPNQRELELISGCPDPLEGARKCLETGIGCVVVKLGEKGCLVCTQKEHHFLRAYPADCIDSTGAGDGFAAGWLWGLQHGWNSMKCARFALATASCMIEKPGTLEAAPDLETVWNRFQDPDWIMEAG